MDHEQIEQIEQQLIHGSVNERRLALNDLAQAPADQAIALLQNLSSSPDFSLRRWVVMGYGNHLTDASFEALCSLALAEPDPNVVAEAANALFNFGDRALPVLQDLFEKHDHWLVLQTLLTLFLESGHEDRLFAIAQQALDNPHQTVKETAILALGHLLKGELNAPAFEQLCQLAKSPVWRTRWRVAIALQHGPAEQVHPILSQLKQDEHHRVVAAAMDVMVAQQDYFMPG